MIEDREIKVNQHHQTTINLSSRDKNQKYSKKSSRTTEARNIETNQDIKQKADRNHYQNKDISCIYKHIKITYPFFKIIHTQDS